MRLVRARATGKSAVHMLDAQTLNPKPQTLTTHTQVDPYCLDGMSYYAGAAVACGGLGFGVWGLGFGV